MELPGGLLVDGGLRREFAFRPVTGALELLVAEAAGGAAPWPERVTDALVGALARLGGGPAAWDVVHDMSVGDRHYLVTRLAGHLGRDDMWLTAHCTACGQPFDVLVEQSRLPVKPAGDEYPFATVDTTAGRLRVRVPTGADQAAMATLPAGSDAERALALRLVVEPAELDAAALDQCAIRAIERAVEDVAPEVAAEAHMTCPECESANVIALDPYICLYRSADELYAEVHALASHYHWGEREILELPRSRRQTYIEMVDTAR